jgi:hypothetical protein
MQMTILNTAKQRVETIDVEITEENTTWFDDYVDSDSVMRITDFKEGLLIERCNYDYPIWLYDISRDDIDHNRQRAQELLIIERKNSSFF